jgi:Bifunctional DNA primase/polymerase, N-terminal
MTAVEIAATLDAALAIADDLGLPVFPVLTDKRPACPHGFLDASDDTAAIRKLWRQSPGPLVCVPTGSASGVDVVDIDPRNGGGDWLTENHERLPATRVHTTRSGGCHYLFAADARLRNTAGKLTPGVDTRAAGGYVIWWPAAGFPVVHPGRLASWPSWLLDQLLPRRRPFVGPSPIVVADRYVCAALANACERIAAASIGARNETLSREAFSLARFVAGGALGTGDLGDALVDAATAAGLGQREIVATLMSALRARGVA